MSETTKGEIVAEPSTDNVDRDIHTSPEVTPLYAAGGTAGVLVGSGQPKDGPSARFRSVVERALETFKRSGRTSMLVLSSNWAIISIPITADNLDLTRYSTLDSLRQLRTLYLRSRQRATE